MAAVITPWRPGCPHREAAWRWVRDRYETAGYEVIEATWDGPRWCKARAVAAGLERTTADRLILADADCWVDGIDETVAALDSHQWAIPHRKVHRLTEAATRDLLDGHPPDLARLTDPPYYGTHGGGIVAIRRDTYLSCPLDPRFLDWGGEDHSWGMALHRVAGKPWIGTADLWHLWHPPQPEAPPVRGPRARQTIPDPSNRALDARYRQARSSPARMRALLDEAKEATWPTSRSS